MRYELMISLRYLFSKKRKRFISLISLISILAVAVGVAALITVLSVMNGFGYELQRRIIGSNPHLVVEKEEGVYDYKKLCDKIEKVEHVKGSYPYIWGQGVLRYRSRARGVVIRSVDLKNATDVSKLSAHMQNGDINLGTDEIILGSELSAVLGAFVGDELGVITSASRKIETFKVRGIFNSGMYEYDSNLAYVSMDSASNLFGMIGLAGGIGIDIDDIRNADSVKAKLQETLPGYYYIRTWMDMNRNLFSALKLEKFAMFIILTLIVIVACFNIISTLMVMVTEKAKDIGILKAIGATKTSIMLIYSLQGLIIGLIGAILGTGVGIGLSLVLKKYQFISLPKDIYYISQLPVKINSLDSFIIIIAALLISFAASIYPAHQASGLDPVEALRYE